MGGERIRRKTAQFVSNVKKIGNGYFVPVPKDIIDKMQLHEGDDVDVSVEIPEMIE